MLFLFACLLGGFIGWLLGARINEPVGGFLLGAFLGIFGWIIILIIGACGPKCPQCKATLVRGAKKCRYCQTDLVVVKS